MRVLSDSQLSKTALLVFANKQDLPKCMTVAEITNKLELKNSLNGRQWLVQSACASSGAGLDEGLQWLGDAIAKQQAMS